VKCFRQAGFHDQEKGDEECEEDTILAEMICSLPFDIQKYVVSVHEMESDDANLSVPEEVRTTP
jgi:hypothetical protein